ncbi:hypothetical protein PMAYCL1PPCAC_20324 [Pristionchus mayeri]|uniref:Uncharacterized protein n=1 Tax=Pristionchus mayeri TaxID=1317129 RepID=A0AAN5I3B5_9BILA|nr:hypothetical protein PMAYCL1PPCAC_20324 [Pristionchus mayeri]
MAEQRVQRAETDESGFNIKMLSPERIAEEIRETWALRDRGVKWIMQIHHICVICLYFIFLLCIFLNFYVLLSREDTVFHLRVYHSVVGLLMICCAAVQVEFMWRTRKLTKLEEPHEIPLPALIGAIALTMGIAIGYLYFIVFNYAFIDCDKLVDSIFSQNELWLETIYDLTMSGFSVLSVVYILHRRYFGAINSSLDKVGRLFINITFAVVWIKVVLYKAYLSNNELCQRKELDGFWCPVMKKTYKCHPSTDLHGTQKMWYYINKGVLNTSIISCASEFFPVLLVTHWLTCGGADERAESIKKRQARKQGLRGLMKEFIKDATRVFVAEHKIDVPPLNPSRLFKIFMWIVVPITCAVSLARWLTLFYYSIDFDELAQEEWLDSDIMGLTMGAFQLVFYGVFLHFARTLTNERLDAHHKAHARGDIGILFGCCAILLVKFILQTLELVFQRVDGFFDLDVVIIRIASLALQQLTQWMGYFALRRILAMSTRDIIDCKSFLPLACYGGFFFSWVHFGDTFLDTTTIKYQLTDETYRFSVYTLVCMIFTQTIFPAEYLYAFTASGCYLEVLHRYLEMGTFQIGPPRLHVKRHESFVEHHHLTEEEDEANKRFGAGENIANMLESAWVLNRKRARSDTSTSADTNPPVTYLSVPIR